MNLERIFRPENLVLILAFSVPIIAIVGYFWHEVLKTRSNNELKKSMLDRGMSVEEIERVLNAGGKPPDKK
mgnify:CR=1 FL=1